MANEFDTQGTRRPRNLPVVSGRQAVANPGRYALPASFASQLIANRDRMAARRPRELTPASQATSAYLSGARITVKRMPAGYNRTLWV